MLLSQYQVDSVHFRNYRSDLMHVRNDYLVHKIKLIRYTPDWETTECVLFKTLKHPTIIYMMDNNRIESTNEFDNNAGESLVVRNLPANTGTDGIDRSQEG